MSASHKKLSRLLIYRDMKKKELAEKAGISIATITKIGKNGAVISSDVLVKICTALIYLLTTQLRWFRTTDNYRGE